MVMRNVSGWIAMMGLLACGGGDDGEGTSGVDTGASSTAATSEAMTSAPSTMTADPSAGTATGTATGTGDDGPPATDDAMSSGDDEAPASSGDDTGPAGSESDSAAGVCEGPQANACLDCAVAACCEQWSACQNDEGCACVIDCHVVKGNSLGSCESQCNSDGELYQGVFFCGQQSCLGTCDWDCC